MKKKSFVVLICAGLLTALCLAGCGGCEKKHHPKCGDKACQKCCCKPCNSDDGALVEEEETSLEVVSEAANGNASGN